MEVYPIAGPLPKPRILREVSEKSGSGKSDSGFDVNLWERKWGRGHIDTIPDEFSTDWKNWPDMLFTQKCATFSSCSYETY